MRTWQRAIRRNSVFSLHFIGADKPLPAQGPTSIGWFTEEAPAEVRASTCGYASRTGWATRASA
ncbi:hypothetical protein [Streptomyces sp. NPDC026589]|uniref:hypothetical protein n=1 Tax=Streptomyces sp. NPDC026589 TaxID=3155609 RepID=UPI0033C08220